MEVIELDGRRVVSTGTKWEKLMGYSRAVRRGNRIVVTGTVGINADGTFSRTASGQARRSLDIVIGALRALGGDIADVMLTRVYLTNVEDWQEVGIAIKEQFGEVRPCLTMIGVPVLVAPEAVVEIEIEAVLLEG
jgi:enamine deaminase RidA (YjgF/YER057c/UK114 family)